MKNNNPVFEKTLSDFNAVPDVFGAFISLDNTILGTTLSKPFTSEKLKKISETVSQTITTSLTEGMDAENIVFTFKKGILVSRIFDTSVSLNILCGPTVQLSSLNVLIDLIVKKVKNELEKTAESEKGSGGLSPEDIMKGPLALLMKEIQSTLCELIGPVGDIILTESLEAWNQNGPVEKSRISDLFAIISKELDSDEGDQWMDRVKKNIDTHINNG